MGWFERIFITIGLGTTITLVVVLGYEVIYRTHRNIKNTKN